MRKFVGVVVSAGLIAGSNAQAQGLSTIEITGPSGGLSQSIWNTGQNIIGVTPGVWNAFGALSICAGGVANFSIVCPVSNATTTVSASRNGVSLGNLAYLPNSAVPNGYIRLVPWTGVTDPVTLNISHPGYPSLSVNTPSLAGASVMPLASNVTVSYASGSLSPTFTWQNPSGAQVDNVRVWLYDTTQRISQGVIGSSGVANAIFARDLGPNATLFTLDPGSPGLTQSLQVGRQYSLAILNQDLRNNNGTGTSDNTLSQSQAFVNFTLSNSGTVRPVYLPTLLPGTSPVFQFNIDGITPNQTFSLDPDVAVGYDFQIGAGNPNFASVTLPSGLAPGNEYNLFLWNGSTWVTSGSILGGSMHSFGGNGVDRFRITGIPVSANLDPADPTAFVTDVTFSGSGSFTGTMTPLTAPVPELETWAMLVAGFGLVASVTRRRRQTCATT